MANTEPALAELIHGLVSGGRTPRNAAEELIASGVDKARVQQGLSEFLEKAGLVRLARIPRGLVRQGMPDPWYLGPAPNHTFWPGIEKLLREKNWNDDAIKAIDASSTKVVSLMAPPGASQFAVRGLVLGYIQSGKTANFSAVIAKAADVGYRFIVVLSGTTNSLRNQTQRRLKRELVDPNPNTWFTLTDPSNDFRQPSIAAGAFLASHGDQRILCVVKKNSTVLAKLAKWLEGAGKQLLGEQPFLMIDDEADQASVNSTGDAEERTAVNRLLLRILGDLPRVSYVGYTATPFANLLIDSTITEDLYPRDFIVDLDPPDNYFGTDRLFGRARLPQDSDEPEDGLDMIRIVEDKDAESLRRVAADGDDPTIDGSLAEAIDYFVLATAARWCRGQEKAHSTMLVHTSQRVAVHNRFKDPVAAYLRELEDSLAKSGDTAVSRLRALWVSETRRVPASTFGLNTVSFDAVASKLPGVINAIEVVVENSRSFTRIDYERGPKNYIVIGGNVLARGLTLEGLMVSFFVRTATAYDALLQMGRWFGYRDGYADLPRVWMTSELKGFFFDLATVEQELRYDIRRYELEQITPLEYGPRIRTHPTLAVTSRLKMQSAVEVWLSYSGRVLQTYRFRTLDKSWLDSNLVAARRLVSSILSQGVKPQKGLNDRHILFRDISVEQIKEFLLGYSVHQTHADTQSTPLLEYIARVNDENKLLVWNVVIVSPPDSKLGDIDLGFSSKFKLINRSKFDRAVDDKSADIKALISENDVVADMPELAASTRGERQEILLYKRFHDGDAATRGLLLLYPISKASAPTKVPSDFRSPLGAVEDVVGMALVFPQTEEASIKYVTARIPATSIEQVEESELDAERA